jgi:hypothetical protein
MYDTLKPARKVAGLVGFGVLNGSLPDGQSIVYRGGTQRFTPHGGETADPAFGEFGHQMATGMKALKQRRDVQPVHGAVVELTGCWEGNDIVLMWRVPCIAIVTR